MPGTTAVTTADPAPERRILHVDMDAFYAAIEQLDRPELRGRPVLVGGSPQGRGVVSTASYEARPFGCRSAMPMSAAIRLCPHAIVVMPRMSRYMEVSAQVFRILERFTPLVEPLSIDEAFLDVTGSVPLLGTAEEMAIRLRSDIHDQTGLTASVGLAPSKFVAKLASDLRKPDGLVIVPPHEVQAFLDPLPIGRLWGVGKATLPRFERMGIATFADARCLSESQLSDAFGESGSHFYRLVRGIDARAVIPDRDARSISHEVTFPADIDDHVHLRDVILDQTDHVAARLRRHRLVARTIGLKIRYGDFRTITRRASFADATDSTDALWHAAAGLFGAWCAQRPPAVRLIGVAASQLAAAGQRQLPLFEPEHGRRSRQLDQAVDEIRKRYGPGSLTRGARSREGSTDS